MELKIIIVLLIFSAQFIQAQVKQDKFQVDFNEIKGELSKKDQFKKDFGRYDGYEIEIFDGEAVNFIAYSNNFQPSLALVDSEGIIYKQSVRNNKGYANIACVVTSGGKYILYVIGDENSSGSYTLQTAVAIPNALSLESDSEFCTTLAFILSHATAYFFLLDNSEITKVPLIKLNKATDAYIDEESGSYKAIYYNENSITNAEIIFKNIYDKIRNCLGKEWQFTTSAWQKNDDYKNKSNTLIEKVNNKPRFIKIVMNDYSNSKIKYDGKYSVEVEINRKQ